MSYLNDLIALIPEGAPVPTREDIRFARQIDRAVAGNIAEIRDRIRSLEDEVMPQLLCTNNENFNNYRGSAFGLCTSDEPEVRNQLQLEHERRVGLIHTFFARLENIPDAIIDPGLKSPDRVRAKQQRNETRASKGYVPDISRVRILSQDLIYLNLHWFEFSRYMRTVEADFFWLAHTNYYYGSVSRLNNGYRGITLHYAVDRTRDLSPDRELTPCQSLTTEVQFVTKRVASLLDVSHPFSVGELKEYPSPEHAEFMESLLLKASILDLEEAKQSL